MENMDGFRDLLTLIMMNDGSMYVTTSMINYVNKLSVEFGYTDWIDAYHNL